jgi:hypothetical protein
MLAKKNKLDLWLKKNKLDLWLKKNKLDLWLKVRWGFATPLGAGVHYAWRIAPVLTS